MALALSSVVKCLFTLFSGLCSISFANCPLPCAGVFQGPLLNPYLFSHGLLPGDLLHPRLWRAPLSGSSETSLGRPPLCGSHRVSILHLHLDVPQTKHLQNGTHSLTSLIWPSFHTSPTKINIHWAQDQEHLSHPWHTHTPKLTTSNL